MTVDIRVRPERPDDSAAVREVNLAAFETAIEADLVDALRRQARPLVSLVAEAGDLVVGHIMFSPVTLPPHDGLTIMGLAPMAVRPSHQRQGIGAALARAGIDECTRMGCDALVVLGHPAYYPRFGFVPASRFGIRCEYDVPDEAFMAIAIAPGALRGKTGTIRYHAAFAGTGA
jgi:putative acetyltransferase